MPCLRPLLSFALGVLATASCQAQLPADLELVSIMGDATVSEPLALRSAQDGSGRLFIAQRGGEILVHKPGEGLLATPLLTVPGVATLGEVGLLGLAFHPNFGGDNRYFYVFFVREVSSRVPSAKETVLARFEISPLDPDLADVSSQIDILVLPGPSNSNHNGGDIHFGPDGYLYLGRGDALDSPRSQDPLSQHGKMLRIEPCATPSCAELYAIPETNPFVGDETTLDEIWSLGWRNPFRWSFDSLTGDMFVGDVGWNTEEEISREAAGDGGRNYGWDCREAGGAGPGSCTGDFVEPILTHPHALGGCAMIGGYRYRGCIAGLRGVYFYADFCSGQVRFATQEGENDWSSQSPPEWDLADYDVFGFGEGEDRELYLLTGSDVRRFESAFGCRADDIFSDSFESGDQTAWDAP